MSIRATFIMIAVCIMLVALVVVPMVLSEVRSEKYTQHEYQLSEISNGIYAIYYTTHSTTPSHNYEVVTLCCNGNIYTFKGHVNISFTNGKPYAEVMDYNIVNRDEIYIYVPKDTIDYRAGVNVY